MVAGIRTPQHLTIAGKEKNGSTLPAMEEVMPTVFAELDRVRGVLEKHYRDMQDIEFTVQQGKLWMLQTRNGKRTAEAALRIAVAMAGEGLIDRKTAIGRIDAASLDQLLHPTLDPKAERKVLAKGLPASPAPPRAPSSSTPRRPRRAPSAATPSSSAASRPAPRTSRACTLRAAS